MSTDQKRSLGLLYVPIRRLCVRARARIYLPVNGLNAVIGAEILSAVHYPVMFYVAYIA